MLFPSLSARSQEDRVTIHKTPIIACRSGWICDYRTERIVVFNGVRILRRWSRENNVAELVTKFRFIGFR
jgi:ATP-dependent RNA circularization protein (DNA/RNA ligase family)